MKFNGNYNFQVNGALIANGSSSDHITFTSNESTPANGDWGFMYFYYPDDYCYLSYCDFSYGGSVTTSMYIVGTQSNINLDNCSIRYSGTTGMYITSNSYPSIKNCIITDNNGFGIQINGNCAPTFGSDLSEWNDIYDNGTYDLYNGTAYVYARYIYWGSVNSIDIEERIYHNYDNGSLGWVDFFPYTNAPHDTEYINAPGNLTISIVTDFVYISWDAVVGATSYNIYSSDDPYAADWGTATATGITGTSWSEAVPNQKKFYYVKALN